MSRPTPVTADAWDAVRSFTNARVALGRAGGSLPTGAWLEFKADHAAARDAIHNSLDAERLAADCASCGLTSVIVASAAADRATYLQRPDMGRELQRASVEQLSGVSAGGSSCDLAIIVSDGLSALAAHNHGPAVLDALVPRLVADNWRLAPLVIARFGRVALEDQIGELLGAQLALMLIGERPGLSSPDSLGAYLVFNPRRGNTDAQRNCVSNIREDGLRPALAAETLHFLLTAARSRKLSGVELKDERVLAEPASVKQIE
jgi:ethanolamine ammonia-lyase small subunit